MKNSYYPLTLYASGLIDARRVGSGSVTGFTYFGCTDGTSFVETTDGRYAGLAMFSSGNTTLAGILIDMDDYAPAIEIRGGFIRGIRKYTRYVSSSTTLTEKDDDIIINTESAVTITLPASPARWQQYMIYKTTASDMTISGNGKNIERMGVSLSTTQNFTGSGYTFLLKYSSDQNKWLMLVFSGRL